MDEQRREQQQAAPRSRSRWVSAAWVAAVAATALNGVVVGYGAVWFQLFGDSADAEDYAVSAGGYGAAAVVLALAVPAILTHDAPRWLAWPAGVAAALLGVFALGSVTAIAEAEAVPAPTDTAWDGVGGVLWGPWTWALVGLGIQGLARLVRRA
jgi:hypothetical protein